MQKISVSKHKSALDHANSIIAGIRLSVPFWAADESSPNDMTNNQAPLPDFVKVAPVTFFTEWAGFAPMPPNNHV